MPPRPEFAATPTDALWLYWIPLGADTPVVRWSGRLYEAVAAAARRRERRALYHAALVAHLNGTDVTVEVAPVPDANGRVARGVVADGIVGDARLGRWRVFRYEVRRWPGGIIPDLVHAVDSPVVVSDDPTDVAGALEHLASVPTPVWGRDELGLGDMWNSNSVVAWTLATSGIDTTSLRPPTGGRAPGWDAGINLAARNNDTAAGPESHGNPTEITRRDDLGRPHQRSGR